MPNGLEREQRSLEEYRDEVLALVEPVADQELVPLAEGLGRVLAAPVTSRSDIPAFANSAMDGYAVRHADLAPGVVLREVADLPAGSTEDPALGPGECARIMTGAPVPTSADTIVPVEQVTVLPEGVRIDDHGEPGRHVRRAAEDVAAGDQVLPAGTVLDAAWVAAAAACGAAELPCVRRPVIAVLATGDELVAPGHDLGRGQIYESNGTFLAAAVRQLGAEALTGPVAGDEPGALRARLDEVAGRADLIVLSGGVSVGDHDVVRQTLEEAGASLRHVRMQPGKPQAFAHWSVAGRRVPVVALPGNPLSTAISFQMFVAPAIRRLLGRGEEPVWAPAVALEGWHSPGGRRQILPVTLEVGDDGRLGVRPAHRRGSASHMVTSLARSTALAMVDDQVTDVEPGTMVLVRRNR